MANKTREIKKLETRVFLKDIMGNFKKNVVVLLGGVIACFDINEYSTTTGGSSGPPIFEEF